MLKLILISLLVLFPFICRALPDDQTHPVEIEAGSIDIDQITHRGHYHGGVSLNQGSSHLRAETAITHTSNNNQLRMAVAKGNVNKQAHYWTTIDLKKPEMHAYADAIYYYPVSHLIKLIGHATVHQGNNSFSASYIMFNIETQHITTKYAHNAPTKITIHPQEKRAS